MALKRLQILYTNVPITVDSNTTIPANTRCIVMNQPDESNVRVRTSEKVRFIAPVTSFNTTRPGRPRRQLTV